MMAGEPEVFATNPLGGRRSEHVEIRPRGRLRHVETICLEVTLARSLQVLLNREVRDCPLGEDRLGE
jgi:hypothetical protein